MIALFFGSFDPIHNKHITIAERALREEDCDEVRFVVTPESPDKVGSISLGFDERLELISSLTDSIDGFEISTIEEELDTPNYTYLTLRRLREQYPDEKFAIVMGSDNLVGLLDRWVERGEILSNHEILVYDRPKFDYLSNKSFQRHRETIREMGMDDDFDVSSTQIRDFVRFNKDIDGLVPESVARMI